MFIQKQIFKDVLYHKICTLKYVTFSLFMKNNLMDRTSPKADANFFQTANIWILSILKRKVAMEKRCLEGSAIINNLSQAYVCTRLWLTENNLNPPSGWLSLLSKTARHSSLTPIYLYSHIVNFGAVSAKASYLKHKVSRIVI